MTDAMKTPHVYVPPLEGDLKCVILNLTFINMTIKVIVHERFCQIKAI